MTSTRRKPEEMDDEKLLFPVETLRHWYVTPFGGMSPELGFFQIGINRQALETNTSLDPTMDRVRVSIAGRAHRRPLLMDHFFEIVPLDEQHPDAFRRSPRGEAVLPEGDQVLRKYRAPRPGDDIVLNNVASQRLGPLASSEEFEKLLQELFRKGYGQSRENA